MARRLQSLLTKPEFLERAGRGSLRFPLLEVWQSTFLAYLEELNDRIEAAMKCGKAWREVETALSTDQAFLDAFEEVDRERVVKLEDKQFREALTAKNAAQIKMVLEARSSIYRKKSGAPAKMARPRVTNGNGFSAENEWMRIFGMTKPVEENHGAESPPDSGVSLPDPESDGELAAAGRS